MRKDMSAVAAVDAQQHWHVLSSVQHRDCLPSIQVHSGRAEREHDQSIFVVFVFLLSTTYCIKYLSRENYTLIPSPPLASVRDAVAASDVLAARPSGAACECEPL